MRTLLVVVALALPLAAQADQVWRWRDAGGRLHYSNVPESVPEHARRVRARVGYLAGDLPAPDPKWIEEDLAAADEERAERAERRRSEALASARPRVFWACPVFPYPTPEAWLCEASLQLEARKAGLGS
jgi:hypothetical protein